MSAVLTGRKTYVAALITLVLGLLMEADWVQVMEDPKGGLGVIAVSILMGIMRFITERTTVTAAKNAPPPSEGA